MDPARTAPNSSSMSCRKWVRRTRTRVGAPGGTLDEVAHLPETLAVAGPPAWTGTALAVASILAGLAVLLRWWFANRR